MHVCMLLGDTYPPDIRVTKEATALVDAGHRVTIICHRGDGEPHRETHRGIDVRRYRLQDAHDGLVGTLRGARYLATYVHGAWRETVADVVEATGVDALHVHDLPLVRTALAVGESGDVPVVADLHENWPEAVRQYRATDDWRRYLETPTYLAAQLAMPVSRWKRIERDCVRRADRVITVVREAELHYVGDCGADPSDVTVVSNVVDLERFDADARPVPIDDLVGKASTGVADSAVDDEESAAEEGSAVDDGDPDAGFVLTYVGTLGGPHRGLETVVRAMPALTDRVPGARLVIVGSGAAYERELRDLVDRLDLGDCVTFTGWVDFEDVPSYLAASDVCLVPHRSTGHTTTTVPHKLFQYMAMSKPVLVTDVRPLARIVEETEAGLVVPAGEPAAMADAAARLAREPSLAADLGRNGRRAVERRYNWDREATRLLELYDGLDGGAEGTAEPGTGPRAPQRAGTDVPGR
jgi:glycosyltransferase involved in cell wall biosynthesis